jgi:hypothetical protein
MSTAKKGHLDLISIAKRDFVRIAEKCTFCFLVSSYTETDFQKLLCSPATLKLQKLLVPLYINFSNILHIQLMVKVVWLVVTLVCTGTCSRQ